jgi:hypothetical protein
VERWRDKKTELNNVSNAQSHVVSIHPVYTAHQHGRKVDSEARPRLLANKTRSYSGSAPTTFADPKMHFADLAQVPMTKVFRSVPQNK